MKALWKVERILAHFQFLESSNHTTSSVLGVIWEFLNSLMLLPILTGKQVRQLIDQLFQMDAQVHSFVCVFWLLKPTSCDCWFIWIILHSTLATWKRWISHSVCLYCCFLWWLYCLTKLNILIYISCFSPTSVLGAVII